jgi:hypothetical protein
LLSLRPEEDPEELEAVVQDNLEDQRQKDEFTESFSMRGRTNP